MTVACTEVPTVDKVRSAAHHHALLGALPRKAA